MNVWTCVCEVFGGVSGVSAVWFPVFFFPLTKIRIGIFNISSVEG